MRQFEQLLQRTIGLDAESIGPKSIQRAVRLRMKSLGLNRPEDYERLLETSRAEWNELIESVIVPETWFFRDPALFAAFVRHVLVEWLPAHPAGPMRVLSIPCASGEEPYSVVMALLDAGVAPERFQVDAIDISARALARAESGVYGKNSFRCQDLGFRNRYFQAHKGRYVLDSAVRNSVRFCRGNVFSDSFLPRLATYNFIFCRNLFIYFDQPTQRRALERIERLLAPAGVLFVGPVECPLVLSHGFISANISETSACRRAIPARQPARLARISNPPAIAAGLSSRVAFQPKPAASGSWQLSPAARSSSSVGHDLEAAQRLADAGRLREAAEICESHLRQSRGSAQAYYLLGLVRDASGDDRAIDCYRKALYLEPNHYESLLQMALLLQKNGDPARARNFRNRAQRLRAKV